MIEKLIFLFKFDTDRSVNNFSSAELSHNQAIEFLLTDSYFYLLRLLIEANLVEKVLMISQFKEHKHLFAGYGVYRASDRIKIICPPSLESAESHIGTIGGNDVIWTRGTSVTWTEFLMRHIQARKVLYNLGALNNDPNIYDLVFIDEDCQFKALKKHQNSYPFLKPCDETVFYPLNENKIYDVISIGTICKRKGQLKIVRAAKKLKRPLRMVFPGPIRDVSYMKDCLAIAKSCDLTIEFPGILSRNELNQLINKSRLHVLASRREQAPRVLIEVASAGVPSLITNRIGGGKNYVTPKTGGICYEWRLAANIREALETWERKPVRQGYLESFSKEHVIERIAYAFKKMRWI